MKKVWLLFLFGTFIVFSGNISKDYIESNSKLSKDFVFPEYSEELNLLVLASGGCSASCSTPFGGTNSCSGSSNCVCSCNEFNCVCTLIGKDQKSTVEDVGRISISSMQYQNIIKIAKYLHASDNENAYNAYIHLSNMMEKLIERDFEAFIKERENYIDFLDSICDSQVEDGLNLVYEEVYG